MTPSLVRPLLVWNAFGCGRGQRTEYAVDCKLVAARTQQKLQCFDGVTVMSDLDHGPWAETAGHVVLLLMGQLAGPSSSSASMTSHVLLELAKSQLP